MPLGGRAEGALRRFRATCRIRAGVPRPCARRWRAAGGQKDGARIPPRGTTAAEHCGSCCRSRPPMFNRPRVDTISPLTPMGPASQATCMDRVRAQFGSNLRTLREAQALTQEALAALAGLDRSYVGGVERGERNPTLTAIARLARALQVPPSSLFMGMDNDLKAKPPTGNPIEASEQADRLILKFRYDQHEAEYTLHGAKSSEYDDVLHTLRRGLASSASRADAVADAFVQATTVWPDANPSDLWTFVVNRIYCDHSNHPLANARLNLAQSWKRTSGLALERIVVRHYSQALKHRGVTLRIGTKAEKETLLGAIDDPRIVPDKADILITHGAGRAEELLGVVHVKASIAERRTDDVPMSQALVQAGYLSVFWTMDSKSSPSTAPVNRGEFGRADGEVSDKRRDFEEHGHFSACFSYNTNTLPTVDENAAAKIFVCNFKDADDHFSRFLLDAHRQRPGR